MGSSQNKEQKIQSVPCLPTVNKVGVVIEMPGTLKRQPLAHRECENVVVEEKMIKERPSEKTILKQRLGELKLKKVRDILKSRKENEVEVDEIQELPIKNGRSKITSQTFAESRTAPVISQELRKDQSRSKKFRISKML